MSGIMKKNNGFSLLETIVAITILTFAMSAVFSLVSRGVRSVSVSSNEMVASFLASEGLEYIRNVRDGVVIRKRAARQGKGGTLTSFASCYSNGCIVDPYAGYSGSLNDDI